MKYRSIDHLEQFEFHDSSWELVGREGDTVTFQVSNLNIHKDTPQNDEDWDMELDTARVTFRGFRLIRSEPGRSRLPEEFQVSRLGREGDHWALDGCGAEPCIAVEFDFDSVEIAWDAYVQKAWYELHRYDTFCVTLDTPEGPVSEDLEIAVHEEDVYRVQVGWLKAPLVTARVCWNDEIYLGDGSDDYLWIDAVAALQKNLPEGVTIRGCISCRYGNLCPVGNYPNEVFCTKDVDIREKSDLFFCTEDLDERDKRSRNYFHTCEDWKAQSEDFFTYNDYLDHLRKA